MTLRIPFEGQAERLIAVGRVVLASFSLLAIWLDPSTPAKYATLAYVLLGTYVLYSLVIALIVWKSFGPFLRLPRLTHVFDLIIFSLFIYFTEGPTSPFFVYFIFSILCATLRWQWRGTLWTAVAALAAYLGMGVYAVDILEDPDFELNRFIIRSVYLGVVAALVGYLGAHESRRRSQLINLAAWPRTSLLELEKAVSQILGQAGNILAAPRVLMAWEEPEEPWLYLGLFSGGQLHWSRKPPGSFSPLVESSLEGKSFFSQDVGSAMALVLDERSSEVQRWHGEPLNRELAESYRVKSLLSVVLFGENMKGRFFFLDKSSFTSDDLVLAEVVVGQVTASMDLFYVLQRLQQVAAMETRIHLARDLHDGVLQSLGATGLQLQSAMELLKSDPEEAKEKLRRIQDLIVQEQRDVRSYIEELKLTSRGPSQKNITLTQLLEELGKTTEQQWNLQVELDIDGPQEQVSATLRREIYHIVREGLVNAARHAQASKAHVGLGVDEGRVRIVVSDNGHGFPFRGVYDQAALATLGAGPHMLMSRVNSLGGSLSVQSADSGSSLQITLPLSRPGA